MASISSNQTGNWSDTNSWVGGVVPVVGDKVTIVAGTTITVDGEYTAGNSSTAITAKYIRTPRWLL